MLQKIFPQITPINSQIVMISLVVFIANKFLLISQNFELIDFAGLYYFGLPQFKPFQFVTAIFMQTNIMNFIFQMFSLVFIGSFMEHFWGSDRYLKFFVASALISTIAPQLIYAGYIYYHYHTFVPTPDILNVISDSPMTMTVALGGVILSLFGAVTMFNPNQEFQFMFIPINIKAKYLFWSITGYHLFGAFYYFDLRDLSSAIFAISAISGVLLTHFFFYTGLRRM
jgi:membrane associated rhomboid family serine protease